METIYGQVRKAYFSYDLAGVIIQVIRDLAAYSWLIFSLMQGMSIAQFVFLLGIIGGFSTWFSTKGAAQSAMIRAAVDFLRLEIGKKCKEPKNYG